MSVLYSELRGKDYAGAELLDILGKSKFSNEHKQFSHYWMLDKSGENSLKGIKLIYNPLNENVDTILICGYSCFVQHIHFTPFAAPLPFNIKLTDPPDTIAQKTRSLATSFDNTHLFATTGYDVQIRYHSSGNIEWIKFFTNNIATQVATVMPKQVPEEVINEKFAEKKRTLEYEIFEAAKEQKLNKTNVPTTKDKPRTQVNKKNEMSKRKSENNDFKAEERKNVVTDASTSEVSVFKKALLDVFKAYSDSGFKNSKGDRKNTANFWNYKYTYSTKLKIPGEKYSLLYSYPFKNSQLDYVSVLKEADTYDASIGETYHRFEKILTAELTANGGWTSTRLPNSDNSKHSDLEFKHNRYGSVILDCAKNPKGRYVVFLRFLFFSY